MKEISSAMKLKKCPENFELVVKDGILALNLTDGNSQKLTDYENTDFYIFFMAFLRSRKRI